jgi:hypothetical protein
MTTLKELLQDADPLQHEPSPSPERRDSSRQAVLASFHAQAHAAAPSRSRIAVLAAVAVLLFLAALFGVRLWSPLVSGVQAAVRFEVRLAEEKPGPGLREAKVADSGQTVYLHNEVIITNGDIASARAVAVGNTSKFRVDIQFRPSGAEKMRAATAGHIGKPVALLLDGQVAMAPTLRDPITTSAVITGNFSRAQAEKIAAGLTPN